MFDQINMSNQRSFNYQFNDDLNELNYFVNKTNFYAFNGIINNDLPCIFLHGPKKSGKPISHKSG